MEQEVIVRVLLCSQLLLSSARMAATAAEVTGSSWLLSPGAITSLVILLVLFILLTSLCSDCRRHSFEVQDSEVDSTPGLIRVVKQQEASAPQENPGTSETDEENPISFTPWRSHLGAPASQDVKTAIPSSTNQTSEDRNSPERLSVKAGLATPTTVQVKEKKPEVSTRRESHPRQLD